MTAQHANDLEIQRYVLHPQECEKIIVQHIEQCKDCQLRTKEYSVLFEKLSEETAPEFSFNVSALIMNDLSSLKPKPTLRSYIIFAVLAITVCSGILLRYVFNRFLPSLLENSGGPQLYLIAISFTGILLFLCVDAFRNYAKRIKILEFY